MSFLAAFTNRKVVGSKPTQIPISTFTKLAEKMGHDKDNFEIHERENIFNGKYYGRYCMVSRSDPGDNGELLGVPFEPDRVASALRSKAGDFVFVKAGRRESEKKTLRYMDLVVASVGIPVYRSDIRHVIWFSTDRDVLLELGGNVELVQPYSLYTTASRDHIPLQTLSTGKRVALEFSGGIGSLVSASILKKQGYNVQLLHFMEGNPEKARQVNLMARDLGLRVDMHKLPNPANALIEENQKIPTDLPTTLNRLGFATYWGMKVGCHYVATGDATENQMTIDAKTGVLKVCAPRLYHLEYLGPVAGKTKRELLEVAISHSLPLLRARSCLANVTWCGWCEKCESWAEAYKELGQEDPRKDL